MTDYWVGSGTDSEANNTEDETAGACMGAASTGAAVAEALLVSWTWVWIGVAAALWGGLLGADLTGTASMSRVSFDASVFLAAAGVGLARLINSWNACNLYTSVTGESSLLRFFANSRW